MKRLIWILAGVIIAAGATALAFPNPIGVGGSSAITGEGSCLVDVSCAQSITTTGGATDPISACSGACAASGHSPYLFSEGPIECDGDLFADANATVAGTLTMAGGSIQLASDYYLYSHATSGAMFIPREGSQTPDTGVLSTGSDARSIVICETGDLAYDFAHAQQTNPTLFIQSANQSATQWISMTHDATNGVIDVGTGVVSIPDGLAVTGAASLNGGLGADLNLAGKSLYNTPSASDAAAAKTCISGQGPYRGIGATQDDGATMCVVPESGANDLTGVTKAGTAGDTIVFSGIDADCTAFSVTITEGDGTGGTYECDGAADDATCVANLIAAVAANATLPSLITVATRVGETTAFWPTPGAASWLKVTPSDGTNTVIDRGTDGVLSLHAPYVYMGTAQQGARFDSATDTLLALTDEAGGSLTLRTGQVQISDGTAYFQETAIRFKGSSTITNTGATATLGVSSGASSGTAATGAASFFSGAQSNTGNYASGAVNVYTGATTTDGDTGDVNVYTGVAGAGAVDAGDVFITVNGAPGVGTTVAKAVGATGLLTINAGASLSGPAAAKLLVSGDTATTAATLYVYPKTITTADSGADANPAATTINPADASVIILVCSDDDGCTGTVTETAAAAGMKVTLLGSTGYTTTIADSAAVIETTGGAAIALTDLDSVQLLYNGATWVQDGPVNVN